MLPFIGLAFVLGIKHSFDADHLIAVSGFLTHSRSSRQTIKMSVSWALGHMITASGITFLLFTFKDEVLSLFLGKMETLVGVMLIVLGVWGIARVLPYHVHTHTHGTIEHAHGHVHVNSEKKDHSHVHLFGIGIIHGIASNGELLILLTASLALSTLTEMVLGVGFFSAGVVAGMVGYGLVFAYPLLKNNRLRLKQIMDIGVGGISIVYGSLTLLGAAGISLAFG